MSLCNIEGGHIRKGTLQAVPDLDEHLAVVDKHEQNNAVAAVLLANTPRLRHATGIVLDRRIALHFRIDHDKNLIRGVPFELGELGV